MRNNSRIEAMCILVAALLISCGQSQASGVFLYEDFDDGNFDGWTVQHPYLPSGPSLTPEIVSSPEGYSIRGVGSGYSSYTEGAYLGRSITMNDIGPLTIEMRAKSGPSWPSMATVWLLNDTQWYRPMDYGESNRVATLQVNLGAGERHPGWHDIGNRAYEWHTFSWNRDSAGWWSLRIDGQMEAKNFWQDTAGLNSFNKIALEVSRNQSEIEWVRISTAPPQPQRPDPVVPAPKDSRYEFVVGLQGSVNWTPIEVGMEFTLAIPGLQAIDMERSVSYPEDPISAEFGWEYSFGANSWVVGEALSWLAPIEQNIASAHGALGVEGTAELIAGAYLEDDESRANFEIEAGMGVRGYLRADVNVPLVEGVPLIDGLVNREWNFEVPIVGTPTVDVSANLPTPFTFNYDEFRGDIAAILGVDAETLDDEGEEVHDVNGVPITFYPDEQKAGFEIGASARIYAETSADASLDFYFREADDTSTGDGRSMIEAFDHVLDESINLAATTAKVVSESGNIDFDEDGSFAMRTGSPVWVTSLVECEDVVNLLAFDLQFLSEEGSEGLLSVYWDDDLVATIDERIVDGTFSSYIFALPDEYAAGSIHELAIRLDSYVDGLDSVADIDNLTMGYAVGVPEPATLSLLVLGGLALFRRRR